MNKKRRLLDAGRIRGILPTLKEFLNVQEKEQVSAASSIGIGEIPGLFPKNELKLVMEGSNPGVWLRRCEKYFGICKVLRDQRSSIASFFFLVERADSWFHNWSKGKGFLPWEAFEELYIDLG